MASYYVYSGAAGAANGTSWTNAYTTLTTAFSGKAAGDVFYVAHDHAEATTTPTLTSPGTLANPCKIICVDRAGSVPPVPANRRTTATVASTTNTNLTFGGCNHYDGIIFTAGAGTTSSANIIIGTVSNMWHRFDNCSLRLGIVNSGVSAIYFGGSAGSLANYIVELNNTTMSFGGDNNSVQGVCTLRWRNTPSALLGTVPGYLFLAGTSMEGFLIDCIGVDLSAAGAGKTLVSSTGNSLQNAVTRFIDCKLGASVTKCVVPGNSAKVDFIRCGATGVNYSVYRSRASGELMDETVIVRSGGASDGTTTISWKVVTTSQCIFSMPFECPPIAIWNDTTGSAVTATVEGIWGGGAVPNDDDIWLDVEYLGNASSPQGLFVNDGKADLLTTAAGQTSSLETWGGSTTKFKLGVTFTAQQKGWIYARVKCAKASSTFYVDPLITLT